MLNMKKDIFSGNNNNSQQPRVAVCLAAYNGIKWIDEQVKSILMQKDVLVTIFISVDKSSDRTEEWVDKKSSLDPRVISLPHGEKMGGSARNFFRLIRDVEFSDYDYISFADQDDIWFETKLSEAVKTMRLNGCDAYSSNVTAFWASGRKKLIDKAQSQKKWDYLFEAAGPGCTYVLTRKLALALKECVNIHWIDIQKIILHDWFIYAFARGRDFKWVIDKTPHMLYRQHRNNQIGINQGLRAAMTRARMFSRNVWIDQACLINQIVDEELNFPFFRKKHVLRRWATILIGLNAFACRRRFRDQIVFLVFCIVLSVVGDFNDR